MKNEATPITSKPEKKRSSRTLSQRIARPILGLAMLVSANQVAGNPAAKVVDKIVQEVGVNPANADSVTPTTVEGTPSCVVDVCPPVVTLPGGGTEPEPTLPPYATTTGSTTSSVPQSTTVVVTSSIPASTTTGPVISSTTTSTVPVRVTTASTPQQETTIAQPTTTIAKQQSSTVPARTSAGPSE